MANTILTDLAFVPETFAGYVQGEIYKRSSFLNSGAVFATDLVFPQYGTTVTLPAFDALSGADEEKGATAPTIDNITGSAQVAPILNRVKKYGSTDLVRYNTATDPFRTIGDEFAGYWAQRMDEVAVASILGAAFGIGATSVNDISGVAGAGGVISAGSIIDTQALMGEFADELEMIVVHPQVYAALRKANLVQMVPDSTGTQMFAFYGDLRVVVSSTAGLSAGSGNFNTLLVARNALAYADATPVEHVLEMDRNIGFADEVASSRRYVLHPVGGKWVGTAGNTNAQLALAANWGLGVASVNGFKARVLRSKIA